MTRRRFRSKLGKTGCLFWLFIFLVIIVIILYRGKGSFKETFSLLKNRRAPTEEVDEDRPSVSAETPGDKTGTETDRKQKEAEQKRESQTAETKPVQDEPGTQPGGDTVPEGTVAKVEKAPEKQATAAVKEKNLKAPLYYVRIDSDGSARLQPVIRSVQFKDTPITRTIESLLNGPTPGERDSGLISFIPEGTKLLSAQIRNGHLTLNFSDTFENNYNGREAILFQLSQVMLTSFEFTQVTSLSILINGQNKRYITGEGIPLKEVYTKDDLSRLSTQG